MNKDEGKQKATHHLTNMRVGEVSFVRAGANGRNKFLLAKTADEEAPAAAPDAATVPAPEPPPPEPVAKDETPAPEPPDAAAVKVVPESAPVEPPAPAPEPAPVEVEKSAQQKLLLHRRVWELIHRTLDTILADNGAVADVVPEPVAEVAAVEAEKVQAPVVVATPAVAPVVEVKLPDALQKALEQVPVLAAEVAQVKASMAVFAKERGGSCALPVDAVPPAPPAPPEENWRTCDDFNAWKVRHPRQ